MRRVGVVAVTGVVLVVSGCSGGGEDAVDIERVTAEVGDAVEVDDGQVVSISPNGAVVVVRDEQLCVLELDGSERGCASVDAGSVGPYEPSSWSPDGQRLAFGAFRQLQRFEPTSISTFDTEELSIDVVVQADDPQDEFHAFPMWAADDELWFLRGGFDEDRSTQLVTVEATADGEETDAVDLHDRFVLEAVGVGARTFGDRAVYLRRGEGDVSVVAIDDEGADDRLVRLDGSMASIGAIDGSGEHMVVTGFDPVRLQPGPAIYMEAGSEDEQVGSSFDVTASTLDPTGRLVAAVAAEGSVVSDASYDLVLWDPASDEHVVLQDDFGAPTSQLVWLDDDRLVAWTADSWTVTDLAS